MDNFKSINELFGSKAGDKILVRIAKFFKVNLAKSDLLARLGPNEFALILPRSNLSDIINTLDGLKKGLATEFNNEDPKVTLSVGLAIFRKIPDSVDAVLGIVDQLLFAAKKRGKNSVQTSIYES